MGNCVANPAERAWAAGEIGPTVSDGSQQNDRIVMVLVYPDAASAQAEAAGSELLTGPRLVPGYGPALLRGNLALVESSPLELSQRYTAELALQEQAEFGANSVTPRAPTLVTRPVDAEFLTALDARFGTL